MALSGETPSRVAASGVAELPAPRSAAAVTKVAGPSRIHIMGGPGSGKTTLATRLAASSRLPVRHLDDVARVGGGEGRLRSATEREPLLEAILADDRWITEGVHLGWTDALLERADVIVWLDYVSWPRAARRIVRRFVSGAVYEMRTRPGREKVARLGDYARSLRSLGGALSQSRQYYGSDPDQPASPDFPRSDIPAPVSETLDSRRATLPALDPYDAKLVHWPSGTCARRCT